MITMYDDWISFKLEKGEHDSRMVTITYINELTAKLVAEEVCRKMKDWADYKRGLIMVDADKSVMTICIDRLAYIPNYLRPIFCGTEIIVDDL